MNGMNETEQRTRDIGHTHTHMIPCFIFFFVERGRDIAKSMKERWNETKRLGLNSNNSKRNRIELKIREEDK